MLTSRYARSLIGLLGRGHGCDEKEEIVAGGRGVVRGRGGLGAGGPGWGRGGRTAGGGCWGGRGGRGGQQLGGGLAIIDFPARPGLDPVEGVPSNRGGHGIPQKIVVEELSAAGLQVEKIVNDWPEGDYCVLFVKK